MDEDSSSEDEQDERQAVIWKRVQRVLAEYCLTPLAMAAARKWVREMADPDNEVLARLRAWMILRINGRERAVPPSKWQAGCPEILGGLRARPIWDAAELPWLRPFEENAAAIRDELLALRSGRGFQPLKIPKWASKNQLASPDGSGAVSHDAGDWNVFYLSLHEVYARTAIRLPPPRPLTRACRRCLSRRTARGAR